MAMETPILCGIVQRPGLAELHVGLQWGDAPESLYSSECPVILGSMFTKQNNE